MDNRDSLRFCVDKNVPPEETPVTADALSEIVDQLELTEPEAALLERAAAFAADIVRPGADTWERERRMGRDAIRAAAELGLTGIEVPQALGGQGARFTAKLAIAEALARADFGFAFSLLNTHNVAAKLAKDGTEAQAGRWLAPLLAGEAIGCTALTEPGAGSDFAAIRTRAEKVDGGWVVNGEKAWITNAAEADVIVAYVQTDPDARGKGIACVLIEADRAGFTRKPAFALIGGHAIGAGGFALEDYFVPDADLLHPPGEAFKSALASINGARTYVAGMCCGLLADAIDAAVAWDRERHIFGRPVLAHQGIRWALADVANDLAALRALTYRAGRLIAAGRGDEAVLAAAHAKKFAGERTPARIAECIQAMGAEGLREDHGLGRHLAGAKIAGYVDGSTEIQNERIAALLFG
jgi:alkylation response protein AidB-like acyl-CoA dehydrogenase